MRLPKFTNSWTPKEWTDFALTMFIGVFTLVNAVVGLCYYLAYRGSLVESGRQNDRLIWAANVQADAAKKMVDVASIQASKMAELSAQATEQVKAANALAVEAGRSAEISKRALDADRARFNEDQRPYIWVSSTDAPQSQTVFGPNSILGVRGDLYNKLHADLTDHGGGVMPPQHHVYSTGFSVETLNEDDVKQIPQHDDGIALLAYFEYFDVRGNLYHTRFCTFRFKSGALAECPGEHRNSVEEDANPPVGRQ